MYLLTAAGKNKVTEYIHELESRRKEILDAGFDTCTDTVLPDIEAIQADVNTFAEDGKYFNGWGVTDNITSDKLLILNEGDDYVSDQAPVESRVYQKIRKVEKEFNQILFHTGFLDGCRLEYQEFHPRFRNFSGHVKFTANVRDEQLSWELDYKPASETAEDFIHKVKAKLLDTLNNYCDIAL